MEFEVPQRHTFKAYIIHWHGLTGFAVGRQMRCYGRKKVGAHGRNDVMINFWWDVLWWRDDEEKRMLKFDFLSQRCLFGTYTKQSTHSLLGAWSFLWIHIQFTPIEGPKGSVNSVFLKKKKKQRSIKVGPVERGRLPWSKLHGPWREPALINYDFETRNDNIRAHQQLLTVWQNSCFDPTTITVRAQICREEIIIIIFPHKVYLQVLTLQWINMSYITYRWLLH